MNIHRLSLSAPQGASERNAAPENGRSWRRRVLNVLCLLVFLPTEAFPAQGAAPEYSSMVSCAAIREPVELAALQRKARQKEPDALFCLGEHYDRGPGADPRLAAQWMRSAADVGHVEAMSRYGAMLLSGRGVPSNPQRAALWLRRAAEQGDTEAQAALGALCEDGRGVKRDVQEAAVWYARAALKKHPQALTRLGLLFAQGRGVERDTERAALLLCEATLRGHPEAREILQRMAVPDTRERTLLLGVYPDEADRRSLRAALRRPGVVVLREDAHWHCDAYNVEQSLPGAERLLACYGMPPDGPPGLVQITYPTADGAEAALLRGIWEEQFGPPNAREGGHALLWNFGTVLVAAQYEPARAETALLYIVPKVYSTLPEAVPTPSPAPPQH